MTAPPLIDYPDAEQIVVGWLAERLPECECVTELWVGFDQSLPVVQVVRVGGPLQQPILDAARLDVDVYAPDRESTSGLIYRVRSLLPHMKKHVAAGGLVCDVTEESGPAWRPDPNPNLRRYGLTTVVLIRPV